MRLVFSAALVLLSACSAVEKGSPMAAASNSSVPTSASVSMPVSPNFCQLQRPSWCLLNAFQAVNTEWDATGSVVVRLSDIRWGSTEAFILESGNCTGTAENPSLATTDSEYPWRGKTWRMTTVVLNAAAACKLVILGPAAGSAESEVALETIHTRLAACRGDGCVEHNLYPILRESLLRLRKP